MTNKVGRPKKVDNSKRKVGRPKGDAAAIEEYKARLLASPKSRKVIDAIFNAALDNEHKHQSAAWKLLADRIMPLSYFEKDKLSGGKAAVNITITGMNDPSVDVTPIEGEYDEDV